MSCLKLFFKAQKKANPLQQSHCQSHGLSLEPSWAPAGAVLTPQHMAPPYLTHTSRSSLFFESQWKAIIILGARQHCQRQSFMIIFMRAIEEFIERQFAISPLSLCSNSINTKGKHVLFSCAHSTWCCWHSMKFVGLESKYWRNASSAISPTWLCNVALKDMQFCNLSFARF